MNLIKKQIIMISNQPTNSINFNFKDIALKSTAIKLKATDITNLVISDSCNISKESLHALKLIIKYLKYKKLTYKCNDNDLLVKDRIDLLNSIFPERNSNITKMAFMGKSVKEFLR